MEHGSRLDGTLTAHAGQTLNRWLSEAADWAKSVAIRFSDGLVHTVFVDSYPEYTTSPYITRVTIQGRGLLTPSN